MRLQLKQRRFPLPPHFLNNSLRFLHLLPRLLHGIPTNPLPFHHNYPHPYSFLRTHNPKPTILCRDLRLSKIKPTPRLHRFTNVLVPCAAQELVAEFSDLAVVALVVVMGDGLGGGGAVFALQAPVNGVVGVLAVGVGYQSWVGGEVGDGGVCGGVVRGG